MDTATRRKGSLVFLGEAPEEASEAQRAATYRDWDALVRSGVQPQGFFLLQADESHRHNWVQRVRHGDWWNLPVFADSRTREAQPYVDGLCSMEQAHEITEGMALRRLTLPDPDDVVGLEERLLYFLYERGPQASFQPLLDRSSDKLYRYPVAELLAQAHEDAAETLEVLHHRGLLRMQRLVDRTRPCRRCGSAHIHFVDICPHCQSLEIHREPTLHCFACGNVGAESQFLESGSLVCSKCHVHLRHIGVDYDKPLAQYLCGGCQRTSMEARIQARCLDCGHAGDPSELAVREIGELLLSSSGRQAVRSRGVAETFAPLRARNYVDPQLFRRMLDWASTVQARHMQFTFHLMCMELQPQPMTEQSASTLPVMALLDEFMARLSALLRDSDVITRMDENSLWVLLPFMAPDDLQLRIERAMEEWAKGGGGAPSLKVHIQMLEVTSSGDGQTVPSAHSLMQRLQSPARRR